MSILTPIIISCWRSGVATIKGREMRYQCRAEVTTIALVLMCLGTLGCRQTELPPVPDSSISVAELFAPHQQLVFSIPDAPAGATFNEQPDTNDLTGTIAHHSVVVDLRPTEKPYWDLNEYNHVRLDVTNEGDSLVWIEGRLDNEDAKDWQNSIPSQLHLLPGESGTLGIAMYRDDETYDGPKVFSKMRTKPNGHRQHWRNFDASKVEKLRLVIRSNQPDFRLSNLWLAAAYPYVSGEDAPAYRLPYLDRWGQSRVFDWPGKINSEAQFLAVPADESDSTREVDTSRDEYGGWAAGPQLEGTGWFRTEKYNDKWWLVDPGGRLFWSHGINGVGRPVLSQVTWRKPLYSWLPTESDPVFAECFQTKEEKLFFDFRSANLIRRYGDDWKSHTAALNARRLQQWGVNTLGAWSDSEMLAREEIPYTAVAHLWTPPAERVGETPDPFAPGFQKRVASSIGKLAERVSRSHWCVGVFVGNEIDWPNDLVEQVFSARLDQPARQHFVGQLKMQYRQITALNAKWKSNYATWEELSNDQQVESSPDRAADFHALYFAYADRFYGMCEDALRAELKNHLYLGSRVHVCPPVVAEAAIEHVDVFSINYYTPLAGVASLPAEADKPVMITEFQFAAVDRGVPGWGLMGVHDQRERARAYTGYIVSGLLDRRIVGAHWFAFSDQSSAGNPAANNQIGFVDIADQPYKEMADAATSLGKRMYSVRNEGTALLESLDEILVGR